MDSARAVRRVGLVVHGGREGAVSAAQGLAQWLARRGVGVRGLVGEAAVGDEQRPSPEFARGLDLIVSVGGDGTLLRAAQLANPVGVPILGVKLGHLGFLTEVEPDDAPELLDQIIQGKMRTEERMALVAEPIGAPRAEPQWALNEVIVEKAARHHMITLVAHIDGDYVARFSADGVIVSTPTGSTAYSFSAGGPIVSPSVECLLLTPVSAHMVFQRTIVLDPKEGVALEVLGEDPGLLSADGRPGVELPVGSSVRIERAAQPARLVRQKDSPSFYSLLREKFSLPGEAPHGERG